MTTLNQSLTTKTVSLEQCLHRASLHNEHAAFGSLNLAVTASEMTPTTSGDDVVPLLPNSIQNGVHSIRTFLQNHQRKLVFQFNAETGIITTTVVDAKRQQVVRQIPLEQALKLIF